MTETLRYRFARPDEIPAIGQLVAHSFPGPNRSAALWQEQLRDPVYGGGPETLLVGEAQGESIASLQLYPLQQWIGGESIRVAGVGMVAVSPAHRKRGIAAQLMTTALQAARERGDLGSALYPFRVSFYQKLGFGMAGSVLQYQVTPGDFPDAPERLRVELLAHEKARAEALELYQSWAPTQNGQFQRTERMWAELLSLPDRALIGYRSQDGQLEGYALTAYRADLPRPNHYLEVDELVWSTPGARRALYAWLGSMGDAWEQILLRALPSQRLDDWLREPRLPAKSAPGWRLYSAAATLLTGPMFRIVDVEAAWQKRSLREGTPVTIGFNVQDAQIPENQRSWQIDFADGRAALGSKTKPAATIGLNISTLSRLYIGALAPRDAHEAGLLECDRPELLDNLGRVLALPEPWSFDRF